jgi:hypothetical protein
MIDEDLQQERLAEAIERFAANKKWVELCENDPGVMDEFWQKAFLTETEVILFTVGAGEIHIERRPSMSLSLNCDLREYYDRRKLPLYPK